jgi:hypothetical protein
MVREDGIVLSHFVDWYVRAGAERILLFYDGSGEEAREATSSFADVPGVSTIVCDEAFWNEAFGAFDKDLDARIVHVFRRALSMNESDWLLLCDADELLQEAHRLGDILPSIDGGTKAIRLRNSEAVWRKGEAAEKPFSATWERWPLPNRRLGKRLLAKLVYGRRAHALARGTTGHVQGKQMIRKGTVPEVINSHSCTVSGTEAVFLDQIADGPDLPYIRHFDAVSMTRWCRKWRERTSGRTVSTTMSTQRVAQMEEALRKIDEGEIQTLFYEMNALSAYQRSMLRVLGLAREIPSEPSAARD